MPLLVESWRCVLEGVAPGARKPRRMVEDMRAKGLGVVLGAKQMSRVEGVEEVEEVYANGLIEDEVVIGRGSYMLRICFGGL